MKRTLKIMLAVVLSLAMLMSFVAAAEDTAATAEDTIASHHDDHALESFSDAPAKDSWKYQGLNCAVNNGVMTGHENKIRPDDSLTRAEMVTMMVRVLGAHANKADIEHYVDVIADQWYYEAIQSGVAAKSSTVQATR
ncbi:MAG: S-layer homology domain-containing protein [Oscillospiraceae bacterium]|nr:S-layer homology domain-containing protein [Oscillospiraceae bacterium]